jgi:CRP-like cAMP-binding protein
VAETTFDFDLLESNGFPLQRFEADRKIFVRDDTGKCMYVVRSGKVSIMAAGAVLENVGPNGIFGEMALIDGSPRSATAVAREPTEVAVIDERTFLYLVDKDPRFALQILRLLAARLRRMTESM